MTELFSYLESLKFGLNPLVFYYAPNSDRTWRVLFYSYDVSIDGGRHFRTYTVRLVRAF